MNYILNDLGKLVVAVGSEGSEARLKVQYPFLLSLLSLLDNEQHHKQTFDDHNIPVELRYKLTRISKTVTVERSF